MTDNLTLCIERGKVWKVEELPPYSIALDGAVRGPYFDNNNMIFSFDHHENCIRHISSASCVQVMEAIMLGFSPDGYKVYINDIDADTVLSFFLLKNPEYIKDKFFVELVRIVGKIDALGPAYPLFKEEQDIFYSFNTKVMDIYGKLKETGEYISYNLSLLLEQSCQKLSNWLSSPDIVENKIKEINFELSPDTKNEKWVMAQGDYFLFGELYKRGYNRIVLWKILPNNTYSYTIAKKSDFVIWDINKIIKELNSVEPGWGGGSTIAGSPRNADGTRSLLQPEKIVEIINRVTD